jgi:UDP-N-acetylglucosamine diphosphorylase / glucose-1-phosphate thymidylyltransferase / UDP-N-acetylgalactosamine diphosphorylase / glucosamine-1-phosphate N-acetyltransferase / galactosamine-1-phosphate N-acetyltransferase
LPAAATPGAAPPETEIVNVVVFEDPAVTRLGVVVAARPACDLGLGGHSLVEALGHFGAVRRSVRPHLARHLAAVGGSSRMAVWGGPPDAGWQPPASRHGAVALAVNARAVPSRANLAALRGFVEAGRRGVVRDGAAVAAVVLHLAADGSGPDAEALAALAKPGVDPSAVIESLALPHADVAIELLAEPHDVLGAHERALEDALAARIDSGAYQEIRPGLFAAPGSQIAALVEVRRGPVVVEAGAEIGPFVCLDGPVWIGPEARVNPHAWLRAGTAVGRGCRVGGEVEASVLEPFSNKPHDGFLGHSHVGSWTNIAAGTITGNLKTTYGPVRLHTPRPGGGRDTVHTGRQFFGALIGEFVKVSINTSLPCGARIGPAATIGGDVPELVGGFHNMLVGGPEGSRSTAEQAATILERMMSRRGVVFLHADRTLLEDLAAGVADARQA